MSDVGVSDAEIFIYLVSTQSSHLYFWNLSWKILAIKRH